MYRNLPQDIRPMGTNNLNQLVHHHLGSQSFDVVAQVQANLPWLHDLYSKLGLISALAANSESITRLGQHTQTLYAIAQSMTALKEIYCKLDTLTKMADDIHCNEEVITELNCKLSTLLGILKVSDIDNLITRYEEIEEQLANTENVLKRVNQNTEDLVTVNKILVHLRATDAITLAQHTKNQNDIEYASSLVQESIKLGNDETINLSRLESL